MALVPRLQSLLERFRREGRDFRLTGVASERVGSGGLDLALRHCDPEGRRYFGMEPVFRRWKEGHTETRFPLHQDRDARTDSANRSSASQTQLNVRPLFHMTAASRH